MGSFRPILFDLDGTLADTRYAITLAVRRTLEQLELPAVTDERINAGIGRGVENLLASAVRAALGRDDAAVSTRAVDAYMRIYPPICTIETRLYPGIDALLRGLDAPLALLTNKPRVPTEAVLEHLGIRARFAAVISGEEGKLKPDPWLVQEALRRFAFAGARPLVVGDTDTDAQMAAAAGVPSCLVRWGYGTEAALAQASFVVGSVDELSALLRRA